MFSIGWPTETIDCPFVLLFFCQNMVKHQVAENSESNMTPSGCSWDFVQGWRNNEQKMSAF